MANTIYIDANRINSVNSEENMNEWTYKLNSELLLPKGTEVQVQNSFINKKGITGGSLEIFEDIVEEMNMVHYITEQGHHTTTPNQGDIKEETGWCRTTLGVSIQGFEKNFKTPGIDFDNIFLPTGSTSQEEMIRTKGFNNCFDKYGGSSQPLIRCKYSVVEGTINYVLHPYIKTFTLFIPKGTYGVGAMGQLIDDQLNGNIFSKVVNGKRVMIKKPQISETLDGNNDFDGNIFNNPLIERVDVMNRAKTFEKYSANGVVAGLAPHRDCFANGSVPDTDVFLPVDKFNEMMNDFKTKPVLSNSPYMDEYNYLETAVSSGAEGNIGKGNKLFPVYYFQESGADGNPVFNGNGAPFVNTTQVDSNFQSFNLFNGMTQDGNAYQNQPPPPLFGRPPNLKIPYDSTNNGNSIAGLHQQVKAPSHNRSGIKITQSGNTIVGCKKSHANSGMTLAIRNCFDAPETRTSGVMIFNWAYSTAIRESDIDLSFMTDDGTVDNDCPLNWCHPNNVVNSKGLVYHFRDFFSTEEKAKEVWKTTIWGRLGFTYDDIANYDKYREFSIWDKTDPNEKVREFGFTTDALLDNTIMTSISGLYSSWNSHMGGDATDKNIPTFKGVQTYGLFSTNTPRNFFPMGNPAGSLLGEQYTNSLYNGSAYFPITIQTANGYTASLLPTLSQQAYFLITADICDNFKDNVKKGDVLPLLGVVPKSNLSNQDFIASENQIVQVIRDAKVINKIKIKILNPDLTAPDLDPFSSVIIKITLPNLTPTPLLPPKVQNQLAKESITF